VRPLLDLEIPAALFAAYDPQSFNSIVVMRDIGDQATFFDHDSPIDRDQAERQLALLACLHARFSNGSSPATGTLGLATWPQFFATTIEQGQEAACAKGFRAAEHLMPRRLFQREAEVWPATVESVLIHDRLPSAVIHGDCHLKQWYRTDDGTIGVTDWQCCTIGNWSRDVAYVLATSLAIEDRHAWERDLLAFYLDRLRAAGAEAPVFDDAWRLYRLNMLSALSWWTATLTPAPGMPDMQPQETSLEFVKRITHAIDDLDSLDIRVG